MRLFESGRLPWPAARRFHFFWRGSIRSGGCSVGPGQIRTRIKLRHRGARPWLVTLAVPAETEQRSLFDGTRTSFLIAAKGDGRQRPRGRSLAARVSGRPIPHNRAPKMLPQLRAFGGPSSIARAGFDRRDLGRAKSERNATRQPAFIASLRKVETVIGRLLSLPDSPCEETPRDNQLPPP